MHQNPPPLLKSSVVRAIEEGVSPPWETLSVNAKIHVLLLKHERKLLAVAAKRLPRNIWLDPPSVVLHACFLFVKRNPKVRSSEQGLLVTIVKRLIYRVVEQKRRWQGFPSLDEVDWMEVHEESQTESPHDQLEKLEQDTKLRLAIDLLDQPTRDVMQMYYIDELPIDEISLRTGLSIPQVKYQLRIGRNRLRELLR